MLHNRHYLGEISHGKIWYPAQHEAIVERSLWEAAHAILATNGRTRANHARGKTPFLLRGLVIGEDGRAMTTSSNRNRFGRVYRYYIGIRETKECAGASRLPRIPAAELESAVMAHLRNVFRDATLVPSGQRAALERMDAAWAQFFPEEQERIVRKLVQRVVVRTDGIDIQFRPGGIAELAQEFALPVEASETAEEACA